MYIHCGDNESGGSIDCCYGSSRNYDNCNADGMLYCGYEINNDGFTGFGWNDRINDFHGHGHFSVNLGGFGDHGKCVEPVISLTPTDLLSLFVPLCFEFTTGEIFFG